MYAGLAIATLTTASNLAIARCAESGDVYYRPAETGIWYLVSNDRVAELGDRLAANAASGDPRSAADVYSRWCAARPGDEAIGMTWIIRTRDAAGEAGDLEQVALCERALAGDIFALDRVIRSVARNT